MPSILTLFFTLALSLGQNDWVCLHGSPPDVSGHSYERLAGVYLQGKPCRILPATTDVAPATSRLVIGRPDDNRVVREILGAFGVVTGERGLSYQGHDFGPGAGLVMVGDDPDGGGSFLLFTGIDEAGVLSSFTTSPNLGREGWVRIRGNKVDARGSLTRRIDTSSPRIERLDRDARYFLEILGDGSGPEDALRIARGFQGHGAVLRNAGFGSPGDYGAFLQRHGGALAAQVEQAFRRRDLDQEIERAFGRVAAELGESEGPRPVYSLLLGDPEGTNARTFDKDPVTDRPRVLLNLAALAKGSHFEVAALHETVHVLHPGVRRTLGEKAIGEGVATYVSQRLAPKIPLHEHLFWSREELRAAEGVGDRLIEAVLAASEATDPAATAPFLVLGARPGSIPGAPSRGAYWVGWLAAKTWCEEGDRTLAELVRATPAEILAVLR